MIGKKQKEKNLSVYLREHGREKRKKRLLRNFIFIILAILFLADGVGYLVFRTRIFRNLDIQVMGNKEVSVEDVLNVARAQIFDDNYFKYLLGFNNILAWPDELKEVNRMIPKIESIKVEKSYFKKRVVLKVSERQNYGVWCMEQGGEKCFAFDDKGIIFSRGTPSEGSLIHNIRDYSNRTIGILSVVLPEDEFINLKEIFEVVELAGMNYKFLEIKDLSLKEIKTSGGSGPTVYFSLRFSPKFALTAIQEIGQGISKLQYLDFRVENKVYYK